jgi:uncharacterized protein (UPF0332 family)
LPVDNEILIKYRIERAKETINDAKMSLENKALHNASNRIYYAIFYIVSALALKNNFSTSRHKQLLGWFNHTYIKTGILPVSLSKIYIKAFDKRQESDYDDLITLEIEEITKLFNDMLIFVDEVEKLITES